MSGPTVDFSTLSGHVIYVFRIDDAPHRGALKVGDTTRQMGETARAAAVRRVNQITQTAGVKPELLFAEEHGFRDHAVHRRLEQEGVAHWKGRKGAREWFVCELSMVVSVVHALAEDRALKPEERQAAKANGPIVLRPEQRKAVDFAKKRLKGAGARCLWNAKMRFGKTLSALTLVKEMGFHRTLILTHRPVVCEGWFDDFKAVFQADPSEHNNIVYGSDTDNREKGGMPFETIIACNCKRYVYFASLQDLRGSAQVGGAYDKNSDVLDTPWDLVIVDEAHEGTQTRRGQAVLDELRKHKPAPRELHLSGTPYNLISSAAGAQTPFRQSQMYTWDYSLEQKAKREWDATHTEGHNPYEGLAQMALYTYNLPAILNLPGYEDNEDKYFNLGAFFAVEPGTDTFVHHQAVKAFLKRLHNGDAPGYPFSRPEYREAFRHTFWLLPGVAAARALEKLLKADEVFQHFEVVNVAGEPLDADNALRGAVDGAESEDWEEARTRGNANALQRVHEAIQACETTDPEKCSGYCGTITLSCGRLTTGVNVPEWTAVLLLYGGTKTSLAGYMQAIFRAQTPWTDNAGKAKTTAYAFDFAPERTLTVINSLVEQLCVANKTLSREEVVTEFLDFCPVIVHGSMTPLDMPAFEAQLRRKRVSLVINEGFETKWLFREGLFNDLSPVDKALIISLATPRVSGSGGRANDVDVNHNGTNEVGTKHSPPPAPKPVVSPEKEAEDERKELTNILLNVAKRLPLLFYGLAKPDWKGLDVAELANNEVVDDASWAVFMPSSVTKDKFRECAKFFDAGVFSDACQRICEMVAAADEMEPTERVYALADLFDTFRNPEKETVLTPWRVVNLHLGATLGGAVFYADDDCREPLSAPLWKTRPGLDKRLWHNPQARVLEVNSKTGLYPLYVVHSYYYQALLSERAAHREPADDSARRRWQRALWRQTLRQRVAVLCQSPMALSITRRTLGLGIEGVKADDIHALAWTGLANDIATNGAKTIAKQVADKFTLNNTPMKFDAIVGNPPYQKNVKDTNDASIYHQFYDLAMSLADYVTLITPARFLFRAGDTPKEWTEKMLADTHFQVVKLWQKASDVFSNVEIKGGVAVTERDATREFGAIGVYSVHPELGTILAKVRDKENDFEHNLTEMLHLQAKFNHIELYKEHPELEAVVGSNGKEKRLITNAFALTDIFLANKPTSGNYVEILGLIDNVRNVRYIKRQYLLSHANIDKWKVIIPKSNGTGELGETLSSPLVKGPGVGFTQSFKSFGSFATEQEAQRMLLYLRSKFCRLMLGILKVTQDNNTDAWRFVPLPPDLTSSDYPSTVEALDAQLADKYDLTAEERAFIDRMIRPM